MNLYLVPFFIFLLFINSSFCYVFAGPSQKNSNASKAQEKRVALVIGNSDYSFSPLINPSNDAQDIAIALGKNNFEVVKVLDATHEQIDEAILTFGKKLSKADVGLFFYAGHGIQANGRNYIIPVDAVLNKQSDLKYRAVDVGRVLDEMAYANSGVNIVILDACRNNSLPRSFRSANRGLAIVSDSPKGTFIAYSTAPGKVAADGSGRNSPYSSALIKALEHQQSSLEQVFKRVARNVEDETGGKQIPWFSSSVTGDFYFNLNVTIEADSKSNSTPEATSTDLIELKFWESIEKKPSIKKYQLYLNSYPHGHFSAIAKMEIMSTSASSKENKQGISKPSSTDLDKFTAQQLLKKCEIFYQHNQLTTGAKGNAYSCYQNILLNNTMDSKLISQAELGLKNIEQKYAGWAGRAIVEKNPAKAKYYISKINQVNPKSSVIAELKQQLTDQQALSQRKLMQVPAESSLAENNTQKVAELTQEKQAPNAKQKIAVKLLPEISEPVKIKKIPKYLSKKITSRQFKLLKQLQNNMVHIKAGCFTMGEDKNQNSFSFFNNASVTGYGRTAEKFYSGKHEVCLTTDFLMSKFEVTQQIWEAVMKKNPSQFKNCGKHCPVERVSWRDVKKFMKRINSVSSVKFRLPTEAEWEYAARSGNSKNEKDCRSHATHPVGINKPNSWGFYDMSGNVWEWVEDWYGAYAKHRATNPRGAGSGAKRVIRGGSWLNTKKECNAYSRKGSAPFSKKDFIGFRLAADLK